MGIEGVKTALTLVPDSYCDGGERHERYLSQN
jgi:hypothetical protein